MARWSFLPSKPVGALRRTAVLAGLLGIGPSGLVMLSPAAAATVPTPQVLYVTTTGADAGNTCVEPSRPCRTIQYAARTAAALFPGDAIVVLVGGGTYMENVVLSAANLESLVVEPSAGGKVTVNGGGKSQVFQIGGGNVGISNLTITGGGSRNGGGGVAVDTGTNAILRNDSIVGNAAVYSGAGVYNLGDVTLIGGSLSDNTVGTTSPTLGTVGGGGGLYNRGTATVTDVSITGNTAVIGNGAGIYNYEGTVSVSGGSIAGNTAKGSVLGHPELAGNGGGLANRGTATLSGVSISHNTAATGDGGGIYNDNSGTVRLSRGSITDNIATTGNGAGISNQGSANLSGVAIGNNTAVAGNGGGMWDAGNAVLGQSLVTGNKALKGTGGGIYDYAGTTTRIPGTAVYGNAPDNCVPSSLCTG